MTKAKRIKYSFIGVCIFILLIIICVMFSGPSNKVMESVKQIKELSDNIRKHYQNRPGYWGLNTEVVVSNNLAPKGMISDGKFRSFAGDVLVGSGPDGDIIMPGIRTFDIVYKNLGFKDCVDLISYKYTDGQHLGLVDIQIINDKGESTFSWGAENSIPINKATAKTTCFQKNDVIWKYE